VRDLSSVEFIHCRYSLGHIRSMLFQHGTPAVIRTHIPRVIPIRVGSTIVPAVATPL